MITSLNSPARHSRLFFRYSGESRNPEKTPLADNTPNLDHMVCCGYYCGYGARVPKGRSKG